MVIKLEAQVRQQEHADVKVSEKGALSIYGMGRYPVAFIESNGNAC